MKLLQGFDPETEVNYVIHVVFVAAILSLIASKIFKSNQLHCLGMTIGPQQYCVAGC